MAEIRITLDKLNNRDKIAQEKFPNGILKTTRTQDYEAGEIDNPESFDMISGAEALLSSRVQLDPVELSLAYEKILTKGAAAIFQEEEAPDLSSALPPGTSLSDLMGGSLGDVSSTIAVVAIAEGEVGTLEGPGDNENPYAEDVGHTQGQKWCATFVAWVFREAGVDDPVIGSASTVQVLQNARNVNRFDQTPKVGDVVFFKYSDALTSHVEIVVDADSTRISTIGGNTSAAGNPEGVSGQGVYRKTYATNYSKIVGYYHPAYPASSAEQLSTSGQTVGNSSTGGSGSVAGIEVKGFGNPLDSVFVTSKFGPRSNSPGSSNHKGIDLRAASGTPVYAAKAGKVIKAGTGTGYGNVVYINHQDGTQTRYAHLTSFSVVSGQSVERGAQIGLSGNTGVSSGPHLHFEIRVGSAANNTSNGSTPVDPSKYIPG